MAFPDRPRAVLGSARPCARRHGEAGGLQLGLGQDQRLVGGASYPLTCKDWMLVPYAAHGRNNLTWAEHEFNGRVAAARGVASSSRAAMHATANSDGMAFQS